MHKACIPEVYKSVVDDVIANCSMIFSKKKINSIILVKLKDLWLSKLEAKGDEYIDLNYLEPQGKTKPKSKHYARKNLPNSKCELVCNVQLKGIKCPEICSNLSMPILEDDTMPQNLQSVICNKSDSVFVKSEKLEEKIKHEQPTNKKLAMKCEVIIKTESEARKMCSNVTASNMNDELPIICKSPIVLLTMEKNFKSNITTKSDLSLLKSTRRVGKHLNNTCLKPTMKKYHKKKCKSKLKQQIPESINNKVEIEKNKAAKIKIQRNVNSPALLKNQFQMDLEDIKENTTGLKKYNYVYKNIEPCENKFGYTPVKIILPHRTGYSIKQRTCIVDAPSWFLVGSRLPRLLSPLIKQVTDLTISDAKSTLQQCINKYSNILQVDGAGVKFNLRSLNYNNSNVENKSIKDTSDLDSNDDVTDDEDRTAAFQSDNNIICQFSLVKQSKHKWNLQLHNGIVYVNNKVFMFKSAVGNVEW